MNVIKKGKDLFWSCLEKLIKMWRCSSMLERSYECNKKRVKIYFGVVWRSMCDV